MIKVLGLALYGRLAASTRYRLEQYASGLASSGIQLEIRSLLGDEYLMTRFQGNGLYLREMVSGGICRLLDLYNLSSYDLVILHCELFPLMPGRLERLLIRKPYIYDFDDAFYLKYKDPRFRAFRFFLGHKFDTVMVGASAITAGSSVLADYAAKFNTNTFFLPTVVDTNRIYPANRICSGLPFTVGWIGSPSTARYLENLVKPLSDLGKEGPVIFMVIGGTAPSIPNVEVIQIAWSEDTEVQLLNQIDVGVMPLSDDEWAAGKCAFKLIQYMACAIPVIASPVGANVDVVTADAGFFARSADDWLKELRLLRDDPSLRQRMGKSGRERVVEQYSLSNNLPQLVNVIRQVANR